MDFKEFAKFVWEKEMQNLGMPHFYLGKNLLLKFVLYYNYFLFPAFIFLGFGGVLSIIVFICEKVSVKFFSS